jgi:hypothetical protein
MTSKNGTSKAAQAKTNFPKANDPKIIADSCPLLICVTDSSRTSPLSQVCPHPWHRCAGGGAVHSIKSGDIAWLPIRY